MQIILTHPLITKFNPITVMVTVKIKSTQLNLLLYEKISYGSYLFSSKIDYKIDGNSKNINNKI